MHPEGGKGRNDSQRNQNLQRQNSSLNTQVL